MIDHDLLIFLIYSGILAILGCALGLSYACKLRMLRKIDSVRREIDRYKKILDDAGKAPRDSE